MTQSFLEDAQSFMHDPIPGATEPVRSTFDGLPGDGGEASISGQSRELEGERPEDGLLHAGYGPLYRDEPASMLAWLRGD